jgi:DNA-binding response OmpR family regulator
LLVDDDESFRPMIADALERFGFDVVSAVNGREALARFHQRRPDLVLTDLIMPDKEGLETIRELQHLAPDMPVIAMSGGGRTNPHGYLQMASQLGASQVLAKPFSFQELLDAIKATLGADWVAPQESA